jgi:ketosteroid isomerase-like protein
MRSALKDLTGPFEEVRVVAHDYLDAGDDRVIAVLEILMRPAGSTAEVSTGRFAYVYTLRDRRIVRIQDFPEPADALEAVGLAS